MHSPHSTGDPAKSTTPTTPDQREKVNVSSPAIAADWLRNELGRGELSCLFRRKDMIVHTPRVGDAGYMPPNADEAKLGVDYGPAQVQPITIAQVKALIEVRYRVGRNKLVPAANGDGTPALDDNEQPVRRKMWQAELFPMAAVNSAVEGGRIGEGTANLRELHGVTHTPILRPDGSVLDTPGYDTTTGVLFLPDRGLDIIPIPDKPTHAQIRDAVDLVLRPVAEFPFVQEAHRANWIGFAFTPILRPLLRPPYQACMIDATNPGSGKGFLAGMLTRLHGGVLKGALPGDNEEMRKQITSTLADTTAPFIVFDNVTGVIRSAALEALLTTAVWSDRWLGHSRDVSIPNDRVWVFTGNNAKIGGDLARRTLGVSIDPGVPDPQRRTGFKLHPPTWMVANRGQYLAALLTIARAWVLDGAPTDITRSDDYAEWAGNLRGLLAWAGIEGKFGGEMSGATVDSSDDTEWAAFLHAVHDSFKSEPFTVKDVVGRLGDDRLNRAGPPIDTALLPGDMAHRYAVMRNDDGDFRKSLGWWFRNREGRFAQGWRVRKVSDRSARVARYAIDAPPSVITVAPPCGFAVSPVLTAPNFIQKGSVIHMGPGTEPPYGSGGREKTAETAKPHAATTLLIDPVCPDCRFDLDSFGHHANCVAA